MKNELRSTERREISVRAAGNSVVGHALVYDSLSEDLGGFVEVIRPGASKDVLKDDVRALFNHNPDKILARTRSGTLQLRDDWRGLAMEFKLGEQTYATDLKISMTRGDVTGCSFSFDIALDRWTVQNGIVLREILLLDRLYDVSVVVFPAYPATDVGLRDGKAGAAAAVHWSTDLARKKLDLIELIASPSSTRNHHPIGENMNRESRFRERATDQGPHATKRAALELLDLSRCACGAAAKEITIDRRGGSVASRCPLHRESRPTTMSDRRLQLALIEREMRS